MEEWREVRFFPGYSVSNRGRVRNDDTGRYMTLLINQRGIANVGLTKNKVQYKRSVSLLVATAFLPKMYSSESFDTPINLDGDRTNNKIENLMWRPRWFAVNYHQQFNEEDSVGFSTPIVEIKTGEEFENSWEAATKYGLIDREIMVATINRTYVWPTYQQFRLVA
jgi:hypothetical protein